MAENSPDTTYIELTATIVSAYVSNNSVASAEIPNLIALVYSALKRIAGGQAAAAAETPKPARRSSRRRKELRRLAGEPIGN